LIISTAALLGVPAVSDAAKRPKAPRGFFGVVYSPSVAAPAPAVVKNIRRMARAGVESMRTQFSWEAAEPAPGLLRWDRFDAIVRAASERRIDLLPVVYVTPQWASSRPDRVDFAVFPPSDPSTYSRFLGALIGRYGPSGSFWTENPDLPRRPIRQWQVWNEVSASYFWGAPDYRRSYPEFLKAVYPAIHAADPGAKVVIAGLTSFLQQTGRTSTSWADLRAFYRNGVRRYFDVLALHPFSRTLDGVVKTVQFNRRVMRRFNDARKPIWLTELSFPASRGKIPRRKYLGLEVTSEQQRRLLADAYRRFIVSRPLRVKRAFWYEWASTYNRVLCGGGQPSFQFVGLVKTGCGTFSVKPTPLLAVYARTARRY
jgi:hypothetical protein